MIMRVFLRISFVPGKRNSNGLFFLSKCSLADDNFSVTDCLPLFRPGIKRVSQEDSGLGLFCESNNYKQQ
ncbi:MAG: hypothetical protein CSA26_09960 [Desulfobacterales bacterium]|nr:MAG: hypothetical protein CSA26_09960 [Desulfobacterales bacterium]